MKDYQYSGIMTYVSLVMTELTDSIFWLIIASLWLVSFVVDTFKK